jgi:hypothetical protein
MEERTGVEQIQPEDVEHLWSIPKIKSSFIP